jgi:hypothetical protein
MTFVSNTGKGLEILLFDMYIFLPFEIDYIWKYELVRILLFQFFHVIERKTFPD